MNKAMPYDISVVITTICRPNLIRAVRSIYEQEFEGNIQIMIGVDVNPHNIWQSLYNELIQNCPANIVVTCLNLGYSTSKRHGGVHSCFYGGSLRAALTLLANSDKVMYLDDDDWLEESHIQRLLNAIKDNKWAFGLSIYADGDKSVGLCTDELESVGVDNGIFKERFGGFVRPSGLLIDKIAVQHLIHLWSISPFPTGDGEDRLIFDKLRCEPFGFSNFPSVYYSLDPKDGMHDIRMKFMASRGVKAEVNSKKDSCR